jgi:hypothetical protein
VALSADRKIIRKNTGPHSSSGPVAATTTLYLGALIALSTTGYLVPASTTSGLRVVGMSTRKVDNATGADGDLEAQWETGVFCFKNDGTYPVSQADVGRPCWVKDDETVQDERGGSAVMAGIVMAYESSSKIWVLVGPELPYVPGALVPGGLEIVSAPGAISVAVLETLLEVDGTDAFTMGDGLYLGQRKRISLITAANTPLGTVTLNGAQAAFGTEPTAWVFTAVGQQVEWEWTATGWKLVDVVQAGSETVATNGSAKPLCLIHLITVGDTIDFIQPDAVWPGQRSTWFGVATAGAAVATVSGLFLDEDGSADGIDINFNAVGDLASLIWAGARWLATSLVSTTITT